MPPTMEDGRAQVHHRRGEAVEDLRMGHTQRSIKKHAQLITACWVSLAAKQK